MLLLRTAEGVAPGGFALTVDGSTLNAFAPDSALGNLPGRPLPAAFASNLVSQHTLRLDNAGGFAPPVSVPGDSSALDAERLLDVLVYIEYTVP